MKTYSGKINIYDLIDGAKKARGLTVIIDVFRAFTLECWLSSFGASEIRPVGAIAEALAWRERDPGSVLIGERGGAKLEGFDFGNSPSTTDPAAIKGHRVIHTTSSGTQGIVNASGASEILTGALVNAAAIAKYIIDKDPEEVSLVAMGNAGVKPTPEDSLCAEYIRSLLIGQPMEDIAEKADALRFSEGAKFFDPSRQHIFPQGDFDMCVNPDIFDFVLRVEKDENGYISKRVDV